VEKEGVLEVSDDLRIKATLPTLEYLIKNNCKIVILFYVGRPDGKVEEKSRTNPHAKRLSLLLNKPVFNLPLSIPQKSVCDAKSVILGQ
jgi:phosphoglycerate kinase